MPRIPVSGGPSVAPDVGVGIRAPQDAFGVNQIPNLAGVQQVVGDIAAQHQREVDEQDQMVVNNADVQLGNLRTDLMTKATSATGHNALGASQEVGPAWEQGVGKILENVPNDRAKFLVQHRAAGYWQNLNEAVQTHAAAQMRKQDVTDTSEILSQDLRTIQDTPDYAATAVDRAKALITDFGKREGWSDVQTANKVAEHVSDIHSAVISNLLEEGSDANARIAQNYLDVHKHELIGGQRVDAVNQVEAGLAQGRGYTAADRILGINQTTTQLPSVGQQEGLVAPGNIDLKNRPRVQNLDGSVSTVRSISIEEDGKTVLIPTVVGNAVVSNAEAIKHYHDTGENLGSFKDEKSAQAYADTLHQQQAQSIKPPPTMEDALAQAEALPDSRERKAAIDQIVSHFTHLEQAHRIARGAALQTVTLQLEQSGGTLNRSSKAWQLIDGTAEGEQALHRQDQILRPPKDPGNPDDYMHYMSLNGLNPASTKEFLNLNIPQIAKASGMSNSEALKLMTAQRVARGADARADRADAQNAITAENIRFQRETALLKASQITDKAERDAEVSRIKTHFNAMQAAHGLPTSPTTSAVAPHATVNPQQGIAPAGNVDLGAMGLHTLIPVPPEWQEMALSNPDYYASLARKGYDVKAMRRMPKAP